MHPYIDPLHILDYAFRRTFLGSALGTASSQSKIPTTASSSAELAKSSLLIYSYETGNNVTLQILCNEKDESLRSSHSSSLTSIAAEYIYAVSPVRALKLSLSFFWVLEGTGGNEGRRPVEYRRNLHMSVHIHMSVLVPLAV